MIYDLALSPQAKARIKRLAAGNASELMSASAWEARRAAASSPLHADIMMAFDPEAESARSD